MMNIQEQDMCTRQDTFHCTFVYNNFLKMILKYQAKKTMILKYDLEFMWPIDKVIRLLKVM